MLSFRPQTGWNVSSFLCEPVLFPALHKEKVDTGVRVRSRLHSELRKPHSFRLRAPAYETG